MKAKGKRQKAKGKNGRRKPRCSSSSLLIFAFCLLPFAFADFACSSGGGVERQIDPDTARRELFLRGYSYKEEVFLDSAKDGDVIGVKLFLYAGMSPEVKNQDGETPLLLAARNDHASAVRALLDHGADPNAKDKDGKTALKWAQDTHRTDVAKLLQGAASAKRKG